MSQLTCKNLTVGYDGKAVLSNVHFSISKGDYLCIVGENGSGKTTLMKAILGLHPCMGGNIVKGDDITSKEIGYLPQQTSLQKDFPASVYEVVLSGCCSRLGFRPFYGKAERKLAKENMEKMNISQFANRCYRELSGGQQQRVLLARALSATRKILLLDEPVAGLDPHATGEMYKLIAKLNKEDGATIIMISHDIPAAVAHSTHILHIEKDTFFGETKEYVQNSLYKDLTIHKGECCE